MALLTSSGGAMPVPEEGSMHVIIDGYGGDPDQLADENVVSVILDEVPRHDGNDQDHAAQRTALYQAANQKTGASPASS